MFLALPGSQEMLFVQVILTGGKGGGAASGTAGNAAHVVRCWDLEDCQTRVQYTGAWCGTVYGHYTAQL
jgi:hypothetical protein